VVRMPSASERAQHYFVAVPVEDGFEVRDEVLPDRVYVARVNQTPTIQGRPVRNPLTLSRIADAIDAYIDSALLEQITREREAA
jgi:hypothetical protein